MYGPFSLSGVLRSNSVVVYHNPVVLLGFCFLYGLVLKFLINTCVD